MGKKDILLARVAVAALLGLSVPAFAVSEDVTTNTGEHIPVVEERAEIAKEEAELARESLALEERRAALAERKASVARREVRLAKAGSTRAAELQQQLADLHARETDRGLVLTLGDILFESGQAKLTSEAMRKLYPLVTLLKESPRRSIIIEGHTDSSGPESYNLDLSQQRADAVRDFLISTGINPDRITARGYGEASPVVSNADEVGRRENRRVEVVVTREGDRLATRR